jgi:hypothetical protein
MHHRLITCLAAALVSLAPVCAQNCSPSVVGSPGGPVGRSSSDYTIIRSLLPYTDESGDSLIAAGDLYFPQLGDNGQGVRYPAAKYQRGHWTPMGSSSGEFVQSLAAAELPVDGGPPQRSIYLGTSSNVRRWTGTNWATTGVSGSLVYSFTDEQSPALAIASSNPTMVYTWRGTGAATSTDPGAIWLGSVRTLRYLNDGSGPALFAAGDFEKQGHFRSLAKLVGTQWQQVPLPDMDPAAYATDVCMFDDETGHGAELYVSVYRPNLMSAVYRRRTGTWMQVGATLTSYAAAPGSLHVVSEQGHQRLYWLGRRPYRFNGDGWEPRLYLTTPGSGGEYSYVLSIAATDLGSGERTYIGGNFPLDACFQTVQPTAVQMSTPASGVIGFTEVDAAALTSGLTSFSSTFLPQLTAVEMPEGTRLIAHNGISAAGGRFADNIAMFHNDQWTNLGSTSHRTSTGTMSVATGLIHGVTRLVRHETTGSVSATHYRDDSGEWVPIPTATGVLARLQGRVHALGNDAIQRLDDTAWTPILSHFHVRPTSRTIVAHPDGSTLSFASGRNIYDYDGLQLISRPTAPWPVHQLAYHDHGEGPMLYASLSSDPPRIARLRAGVWEDLPSGLYVHERLSIASFDDGHGKALYVTGGYAMHPGNPVFTPIARFRHNSWESVTDNISPHAQSLANSSLAVVDDRLYIAGNFKHLGHTRADHFGWVQSCPRTCTADFDGDGSPATDADIEAFFLCLAGTCCPRCTADFNNDGDTGTDADIEAFFRVLAGGNC